MIKIFIIIGVVIIAVLVFLFFLGVISRSGTSPGLINGKLARCPDRPNCLCSEYREDKAHYTDPVTFPRSITDDDITMLASIIQEMGGSVEEENGHYLAATFKSSLFGFVDDFELRIARSQNVIHIRSGSRVGYSDMGVNAKRVELFKSRFNKKRGSITR